MAGNLLLLPDSDYSPALQFSNMDAIAVRWFRVCVWGGTGGSGESTLFGRQCGWKRRWKRLFDEGDVKNIDEAMRFDVFRPQMLDERVITGIFRYNVQVRLRVAHRQHAGIEGDMKIERIRAIAGQFDAGCARSHAVHRQRELKRRRFLACADNDDHTHLLVVEQRQEVGLDVFVVDEDVVSGDRISIRSRGVYRQCPCNPLPIYNRTKAYSCP